MRSIHKTMLVAALALAGGDSAAAPQPGGTSRIDRVLVYSTSARVSQLATVTTRRGSQRLVIADLPRSVSPDDVQVTCKTAQVQRVEASVARGRLPRQARAKKLADQLQAVADQLRSVNDEMSLLQRELRFVRGLRLRSTPPKGAKRRDPGLFVDSWRRILRWVEGRAGAVHKRLKTLKRKRHALRKQRHKLKVAAKELDLAAVDREVLQVSATIKGRPGRHKLVLSYPVRGVSWRPSYDLRYNPARRRVDATYYAVVRQRSGEDWKGAKLRFSTARPTHVVAIPRLASWTVGRKRDFIPRPRPRYERQVRRWRPRAEPQPRNPTVQRLRRLLGQRRPARDARYKSGTRRPHKRPLRKSGRLKKKTYDFDDDKIDGQLLRPESSSLRGRGRRSMRRPPAPPAAPQPKAVMPSGGVRAQAQERVQRIVRRVRAERLPWTNQRYRPPRLPPDSPAAAAKGYLFTLYAPGRHEVPASGEARRIPLIKTSLAVKPIYRILPGRSSSAYLMAELKNTTGRPILRGRANLFAGAMYSGRSWLNTALPGRTLRLPLGIDDAIKVVRHLRQKTVVKGLVFKDDVTEYTVSIEIANHRRYPITADVRDQVPKPLFKKIEIKGFSCKTDGKTRSAAAPKKGHQRGWTKPDDDGRVIWFGRVGAGKVRKLSFTFRIVRPKDWILRQHGG